MNRAGWPNLVRRIPRLGFIGWGWSVLLLSFTLSSTYIGFQIVGYRWSTEFVLASFLLLGCATYALSGDGKAEIDVREFKLFLAPLALFVIWSGLSVFWARSFRGAVHHTLLWASFVLFFVLIRQAQSRARDRERSLKIASLTALVVAGSGLIVYLGYPGPTDLAYNARYYLVSEVLIPLMPVFVILAVTRTRKWGIIFGFAAVLIWLLTLTTGSRAMFIAGVLSLLILPMGLWLSRGFTSITKRSLVLSAFLISLAVPYFVASDSSSTVVGRFSTSNAQSSENAQSRLLFWALAIEGFRANPVKGVAAGNYFARYEDLRFALARRSPESPLLSISDDAIPERAHNEYLQILGELGLIGIGLFGAAIVGLCLLFARGQRPSLLSISAFAGICALLASSFVSSYSFRFTIGGVTFFFLASMVIPRAKNPIRLGKKWSMVGCMVALCLIGFSLIRGASIYYFSGSVGEQNFEIAEERMSKALALDPAEPMFRQYYGQILNLQGRFYEAEWNLRFAVENGMANSTTCFVLAQTYVLGGKADEADETFHKAVVMYPRSVFLRTAYANFLTKNGDANRAYEHSRIAEEIDPAQTRSWQLAHSRGLEALSLARVFDPSLLGVGQLLPADGPLVLVNFEQASRN